MRCARSSIFALILVSLHAGLPGAALAQSSAADDMRGVANEKARQTFKEGVEAFDRRDFEAARVAFLQTFALKPSAPVVRRNLGLAEIYSGHYLDGARRLARVLHTTDEGTAQDRARMLESLKKAEAHLERLTLEVNVEGAEIMVDGVDLGTSPLPFVWYMAPGSYDVRIQKPGYEPFFQRRIAHAGQSEHLRITLKPRAEAAPPEPRVSIPMPLPVEVTTVERGPSSWVLVTGSVLTAAGVAAGVSFTLAAQANEEKASRIRTLQIKEAGCPSSGFQTSCDALRSALDQHDQQRVWATLSFMAAGAAGVATLLYGLLASASDRRGPPRDVALQDSGLQDSGLQDSARQDFALQNIGVGFDAGTRSVLVHGAF